MKTISVVFISLMLSGCSFILPKPHDPEMFGMIVDVKIAIDKLDCTDKEWKEIFDKVERLKVYTSLRKDPQAKAVQELKIALTKAQESNNQRFCESVLKINRSRVDVIADAWRGR